MTFKKGHVYLAMVLQSSDRQWCVLQETRKAQVWESWAFRCSGQPNQYVRNKGFLKLLATILHTGPESVEK